LISVSVGIKCCRISIISVFKILKSRLKIKIMINFKIYSNSYLFNAREIVFTSRSSFRRAIPMMIIKDSFNNLPKEINILSTLYDFDFYIPEVDAKEITILSFEILLM
jgi:hypothetical protein